MNIPGLIFAGDVVTWPDGGLATDQQGNPLPAAVSGAWALSYRIAGPAAPVTLTSTSAGTGWTTTLPMAASNKLLAGRYAWQAFATDGAGNRATVGVGQLVVETDLARAGTGFDGRSRAQRIVDAIEAELEARATGGGLVVEYTIGGRNLKKETAANLMTLRGQWLVVIARERRAESMRQGMGDPSARFAVFRRSQSGFPWGNW